MPVTASQLYDHVTCPHRVHLDQFGEPDQRDEISPFIRLLWERGTKYETQVVSKLAFGSYLSIRDFTDDAREDLTRRAMEDRAPLIYGGRLSVEGLIGEPDLLILSDGKYVAADIKSGRGKEGDSDEGDGKPKAHYAVQLAFYADILDRLGFGLGRIGEIWDINGDHVRYELDRVRHSRTDQTWWDFYQESLAAVTAINERQSQTRAALASICKLCHWHSSCRADLVASSDLSLVPGLGRSRRDAMFGHFENLNQFAGADAEAFMSGKKTIIAGVGPDMLRLFQSRARLLRDPAARPYLRAPIELSDDRIEVFFDIEADPMNDIIYLHGFVERDRDRGTSTYTYFFADKCDASGERDAFGKALQWLRERPQAPVFYYSKYERTMYRKLARRHEGLTTEDEIESIFTPPRSFDLYTDVVYRATEWPTHDHSIKTLAKYLGFAWRDTDPSGASSIEWYQRWIEFGDPDLRQRIIDYNEDDCLATAVLLDGIRSLEFRESV